MRRRVLTTVAGLLGPWTWAPAGRAAEPPRVEVQSLDTTFGLGATSVDSGGRWLATGGQATIVWDLATGIQLFRRATGSTELSFQTGFTLDGQRLVIASPSRLEVLDVARRTVVASPKKRCENVAAGCVVMLGPAGTLIAVSERDQVHVSALDGRLLYTARGRLLAIAEDDARLAVATPEGLLVLDARTGARLHVLPAADVAVFSPDHRSLARAGGGAVSVVDLATAAERWRRPAPGRGFSLAFTRDGQRLGAVVELTRTIYDAATGAETPVTWSTPGLPANQAQKVGRLFATVPHGLVAETRGPGPVYPLILRVFSTGDEIATFTARSFAVRGLDFQDGGRTLVLGGALAKHRNFRGVRSFDLDLGRQTRALPGEAPIAVGAASVAIGTGSGTTPSDATRPAAAELFVGGESARRIAGASVVGLSRDDETFAVQNNSAIEVLEAKTGRLRCRIDSGLLPGLWVDNRGAALSPDGRTLAVVDGNTNKTTLVDVERCRLGKQLRGTGRFEPYAPRFTADGKRLVFGSAFYDGTARVYDVASGRLLQTVRMAERGYVNGADLSPDGRRLATGGQDHTFRIWDVSTGKALVTRRVDSEIQAVAFAPDGAHVVFAEERGFVHFFSVAKKAIVASLVLLGEQDWVVVAPDGRFDGTTRGLEDLHVVDGLRPLPLESFFARAYAPKLLPRLLGRPSASAAEGAPSVVPAGLVGFQLPPTVKIVSPQTDLELGAETLEVELEVTDAGGGIAEVQLLHNGHAIQTEATRGLRAKAAARVERLRLVVDLVPGENRLEAIAVAGDGTRSVPVARRVTRSGILPASRLWVLTVGIDAYQNPKYALAYPRADAAAFVAKLRAGGAGIFAGIEHRELVDAAATRDGIVSAMEAIAKAARPVDTFVFFFAGHGVMSEGSPERPSEFFLVTPDVTALYGDDAQLHAKALPAARLKDLAGTIAAQRQIYVLDACQAAGALDAFATRGAAEEKAILQIARSAGVAVLAATGAEQYANEVKVLGHGVFTRALLDGLDGKADLGGDGKVTVKELEAYLNDQVPELARRHRGQPQYPSSYSRGQDFPLVVRR